MDDTVQIPPNGKSARTRDAIPPERQPLAGYEAINLWPAFASAHEMLLAINRNGLQHAEALSGQADEGGLTVDRLAGWTHAAFGAPGSHNGCHGLPMGRSSVSLTMHARQHERRSVGEHAQPDDRGIPRGHVQALALARGH